MRVLPKFLIVTLLIITFFLPIGSAFAQTPSVTPAPINESLIAETVNSDVPQNLNTITQSVALELMGTTTCLLAGFNALTNDTKCLGYDTKTKKLGYVESNGGAVGAMGNLIGMTYNIPISSTEYVAYLQSNFGLAKPAYAQVGGIGFSGLGPVVNIWSQFRNVTYLLFVLIFVLIGLGIMFRLQIDARTVMTIQNQIPKIIITLILVTFSYAIAGLLVDLMWVSTYVSARVITNALPNSNDVYKVATDKLLTPPMGYANETLPGGVLQTGVYAGTGIGTVVSNLFTGEVRNQILPSGSSGTCNGADWTNVGCWGIVQAVQGIQFGQLIFNIIGSVASFVIGVLAIVIISVAILAAMFRLWFTLIKAYVFILISVALAPFYIMTGLLPGGGGFGGWLRDLLGNLSAFPTTIIMFLLARVFIESFGSAANSNQFIPPLIGNPGPTNALAGLIGMGIILITPEVVTITRDFLKSPQFKYMSAVGAGLGAGQGMAGGLAGGIWSRMFYTDKGGNLTGWAGRKIGGIKALNIGKLARFAARAEKTGHD